MPEVYLWHAQGHHSDDLGAETFNAERVKETGEGKLGAVEGLQLAAGF